MIEIIKATPEDASLVARLHVWGWRDGYAGLLPQAYLDSLSIAERTERWHKNLADGSTLWIANYNHEPAAIIGFGSPLNPVPAGLDNCGEITMIYTLAKFYRRGIGEQLFNHACTSLKDQGFKCCYLWCLEENIKGRSFYDKMGGKIVPDAEEIALIDGQPFKEIAYHWALSSIIF